MNQFFEPPERATAVFLVDNKGAIVPPTNKVDFFLPMLLSLQGISPPSLEGEKPAVKLPQVLFLD